MNYLDKIINKYSATPKLPNNAELDHRRLKKENTAALEATISSICRPKGADKFKQCIHYEDCTADGSSCPGPNCDDYEV